MGRSGLAAMPLGFVVKFPRGFWTVRKAYSHDEVAASARQSESIRYGDRHLGSL